ncbi:MAG TPA: alkaline phosphatase family protein [Terracidiphilus sp.]|jgi:phospholipase C|nr:alkaline phosphatase family protein [Terracidiphilus sp.]
MRLYSPYIYRQLLLFVAFTLALPFVAHAQTLHHIKTVWVIVMENHNWTGDGSLDIANNPDAPYINYTLIPMASYARDYNNPPGVHPSLPNYIWLEAGASLGTKGYDGTPYQFPQSTTNHLTTLLEKAGISWRAYEENITGTTCPLTSEGSLDPNGNRLYQPRHDPFVYFEDQTNNLSSSSSKCISHIRPFSQLDTDLANNTVARYNFITPNLCDDMHDSCDGNAIAHGDTWLKDHLPAILNSTAYRTGGAIFITWDEAAKGDGPVPMIVLSPFGKGNHYSNSTYYTHSSTLRTMQEIFGVYPYIRYAADAHDLSDLFLVFP